MFLYWVCKLRLIRLTINLHLVNTHIYTCSRGILLYFWQRVCSQDMDYYKNMHTDVWPLIFLVIFIPEYNLKYQPLPCSSIHTYFLEYIHLLWSNGFPAGISLKLRPVDTVSPTWLIIFSTRSDCNISSVPYEFFLRLTPR